MRILGLDPGLNRTGWGVIDAASGRFVRVDSGMIRVPEGELSARLGHIVRELSKVIERTKPDLASAERVFVNVNPQSTLRLGQARGAALVAADLAGLPVEEFTPSEIKEAVCATGRADKPMVQRMIGMLLGIEGDIQADEADALACAVCCANSIRMRAFEKAGSTTRTYATPRRGRSAAGARSAWTALFTKEGENIMIGRLHGKLIEKTPPQVLVDVGGVGYEVDVPMSTFCNLPAEGSEITLLTHFIVREDAQLLYGFATAAERQTFRALIRISGVGPRIALAVLSGMSTQDLADAVEQGNATLLTRVPGIGKKTADRLVLELKGKLAGNAFAPAGGAASAAQADILSALMALGYSEREAQASVRALPAEVTVSEGIRLALKALAR